MLFARALLLLLVVSSGSAIAAPKRRIIAILDVRVDGVPREIASQFQSKLEQQLDNNAYWIAPASRVHELMGNSTKWTEGCVVGPCLSEVRVQTGAELVLLASITGSGTSFGYVVTLVRTDTGRYLAQEAQRCDVCTVNEALSNATLAAVKLLTSMPDKLPDDAAEQGAALDLATAKLEQTNRHIKHRRKKVGMILALTGLAVAAGGAALYAAQDHAGYALGTAAAGGGLALGGLVVLAF